MSLIGSVSKNCEHTNIFAYGQIKIIWVFSDDSGIRALKVKLSNGDQYEYGTEDTSILKVEEFSFEKGK